MSRSSPLSAVALRGPHHMQPLLSGLARLLKERHGSAIHVYCNTPQVARLYKRWNTGHFDSINVETVLHRAAERKDLDANNVITHATEWERRLGKSIHSLLMTNRHLGRSFSLGGFRHPRSFQSERTDNTQALHGATAVLDYWATEIEQKSLSLILNPNKEISLASAYFDVPYRIIVPSNVEDYYYWAHNEFLDTPIFERAIMSTSVAAPEDIREPYKEAIYEQGRVMRHARLSWITGKLLQLTARHAYGKVRGYDKSNEILLREKWKTRIRGYRALKELTGPNMARLRDMSGKRFVFYALQEEPETSLTVRAPEFPHQMPIIALLARDMPADVTLVVKETVYAIGRRNVDFYNQIREFKNVVFLNVTERGIDVVREATAVATISSTVGLEAAIMGKPVLSFGRHNIYNFVPHVNVITSFDDIANVLARVLGGAFDSHRARLDGARLLGAIKKASFRLRDFNLHEPEKFPVEAVEEAYGSLLESLGDEFMLKAGIGSAGEVGEESTLGQRPTAG